MSGLNLSRIKSLSADAEIMIFHEAAIKHHLRDWLTTNDGGSKIRRELENPLRPYHHWIYWNCRQKILDPQLAALIRLDRIAEIDSASKRVALQWIANNLMPQEGTVHLKIKQQDTNTSSAISYAMTMLQQCWPRGYTEFCAAIKEYVIVSGDSMRSASVPSLFGTIFIGSNACRSPANALEILVHETAHHALAARQRFVKFSDTKKRQVRSVLRVDNRPQEAALHAAFVCARVAVGTQRCIKRGYNTGEMRNIFERNYEDLHAQLQYLLDTDGWTNFGEQLLVKLCRLLQRM